MWDEQHREIIPPSIGKTMQKAHSQMIWGAATAPHWAWWVYMGVAITLHFIGLPGVDDATLQARLKTIPSLLCLFGVWVGASQWGTREQH